MVPVLYNIDAGTEEEIPIPNVNAKTLKKVIEYCTMHKNNVPPEIEKPLKSANFAEVTTCCRGIT